MARYYGLVLCFLYHRISYSWELFNMIEITYAYRLTRKQGNKHNRYFHNSYQISFRDNDYQRLLKICLSKPWSNYVMLLLPCTLSQFHAPRTLFYDSIYDDDNIYLMSIMVTCSLPFDLYGWGLQVKYCFLRLHTWLLY